MQKFHVNKEVRMGISQRTSAGARRLAASAGQCVFRIVEHTNYHLSSILTNNAYGLEQCGVVGEWNLTTDTGELCMKGKVPEGLFLKNGNGGTEYVIRCRIF